MSSIVNDFNNTSYYLPNLFAHMNGQLYLLSQQLNIKVVPEQDVQLLRFFSASINFDNTVSSYFDEIKSLLKSEPPINRQPYYDFTDGYLYDSNFNVDDFCLAISNNINRILIVYEKFLNEKYETFEKNTINSINSYLKKYDRANRKMSCFEFLEIIYAKILKKNLTNEISVSVFNI